MTALTRTAALAATLALLAGCGQGEKAGGNTAAPPAGPLPRIAFPAPPPNPNAGFPLPDACARLSGLKPRDGDLPDVKTAARLKDCSSAALYYGLGAPKDAGMAKWCAYTEMAAPPEAALDPLSGPAVLMMIYANGDGAKRDLDLATHMACRVDMAAPAETQGRVERLQAMKGRPQPKEPFDYCDDVTSGYAGGVCANLEAERAQAGRAQQAQAATAGWTPAQQAALAALEKTQAAFAEAHAGEADQSGTLRAALATANEEEVRDFDAALLQQLAKGRLPAGSPAARAAADARLNQVYRSVVGYQGEPYGTVTADDVRAAQRAWLKHRDAWLALARSRGAPTDGLAEALTVERTRQLACGALGPELEGYDCE